VRGRDYLPRFRPSLPLPPERDPEFDERFEREPEKEPEFEERLRDPELNEPEFDDRFDREPELNEPELDDRFDRCELNEPEFDLEDRSERPALNEFERLERFEPELTLELPELERLPLLRERASPLGAELLGMDCNAPDGLRSLPDRFERLLPRFPELFGTGLLRGTGWKFEPEFASRCCCRVLRFRFDEFPLSGVAEPGCA
jgi:hypothetical protein